MSQLFTTFTLNITKDNIPEGTDPLVLEIYAQLMDLYTSELEFWYDVEKTSNQLKIFPAQPTPFVPVNPWATKARCSKCGIDLNQSLGYCCPNMECPTGLGPVMCQTNV